MWAELLGPALGAGGLLSIVFLMVITGKLIPLRTHERELADRKVQIDRLTAALDKTERQRDRLMGLAGDVTAGIVAAIPAASAKDTVS